MAIYFYNDLSRLTAKNEKTKHKNIILNSYPYLNLI